MCVQWGVCSRVCNRGVCAAALPLSLATFQKEVTLHMEVGATGGAARSVVGDSSYHTVGQDC